MVNHTKPPDYRMYVVTVTVLVLLFRGPFTGTCTFYLVVAYQYELEPENDGVTRVALRPSAHRVMIGLNLELLPKRADSKRTLVWNHCSSAWNLKKSATVQQKLQNHWYQTTVLPVSTNCLILTSLLLMVLS